MCTTLASDSIYQAFLSKEKKDALLHGHSYTAHAVGCEVANSSLKIMMDMEEEGKWDVYKRDWVDVRNGKGSEITKHSLSSSSSDERHNEDLENVWSVWSPDFVRQVSMAKEVESVIALGSVLAISLHDNEQAGKNESNSLISCS